MTDEIRNSVVGKLTELTQLLNKLQWQTGEPPLGCVVFFQDTGNDLHAGYSIDGWMRGACMLESERITIPVCKTSDVLCWVDISDLVPNILPPKKERDND
jgi:hypothetical protein